MNLNFIYRFILLVFSFSLNLFGQEIILLDSDKLFSERPFFPHTHLKFSQDDSTSFKETNYNDAHWGLKDTRILPEENKFNENTVLWFRLKLNVDSTIVDRAIGMYFYNTGIADIYLNGHKIYTIKNNQRKPVTIVFNKKGENIFAIKFKNPNFEYLAGSNSWAGFRIAFQEYNNAVESFVERDRSIQIEQMFFLIPAVVLSILHLIIFFFDKRKYQNFYYFLFLFSFAIYIIVIFYSQYADTQINQLRFERFAPLLLNSILLFGALTIFAIFNYRHKYSNLFILITAILGVAGFILIRNMYVWYISYAFISVVSSQAGYVLFKDKNIKDLDILTVRIGFMLFSISGIYQMLLSFDVVPPILGSYNVFLYGVLGFLFSMSVALAYRYVSTGKNLEEQIVQVKELSAKSLAQELEAKEMEVQKKVLEAENSRKSKELEEARQVQLAMLPKELPDIDNLDIAVYMRTATEVGGDYYDFIQSNDGKVIVAVGDATGHGMRAGLMVATIKSLFSALAERMMIPDFFNRCTDIIKGMKLGNLFMSLSLLQIKGETVWASGAGMPPILIYRDKIKEVETLTFKSMPVGAFNNFPYEMKDFEFNSGDVIFLMSDGLPELFNLKKEMFDYERSVEVFKQNAGLNAEEIIEKFKFEIKSWLNGLQPMDDITLVVIKYKK